MVRDVAKTVLVDIRDHDKNDCERNVFCVEKARTLPRNLTIFHLCSIWVEWTPVVDFFLIALSTQISGPSCDSDIKPDQCKSLVWESHVRQQIFVVFEDVYR